MQWQKVLLLLLLPFRRQPAVQPGLMLGTQALLLLLLLQLLLCLVLLLLLLCLLLLQLLLCLLLLQARGAVCPLIIMDIRASQPRGCCCCCWPF